MLRASKWKDRACDPEAAKEVIKDQKVQPASPPPESGCLNPAFPCQGKR